MSNHTKTHDYEQARDLAENHPHRHHYPDGYRNYFWCNILYVASLAARHPQKTQPATRNFATFVI